MAKINSKILTAIAGIVLFKAATCSISKSEESEEFDIAKEVEKTQDFDVAKVVDEVYQKKLLRMQQIEKGEVPEDKEALNKLDIYVRVGLADKAAKIIEEFLMGKYENSFVEIEELIASADEDFQKKIIEELKKKMLWIEPESLFFFLKGLRDSKYFPEAVYLFRWTIMDNLNSCYLLRDCGIFYDFFWDVINDEAISDKRILAFCETFKDDDICLAIAFNVAFNKKRPIAKTIAKQLAAKNFSLMSDAFINDDVKNISFWKDLLSATKTAEMSYFLANVDSVPVESRTTIDKRDLIKAFRKTASVQIPPEFSFALKKMQQKGSFCAFATKSKLLEKSENPKLIQILNWAPKYLPKASRAALELFYFKAFISGFDDLAKIALKYLKDSPVDNAIVDNDKAL